MKIKQLILFLLILSLGIAYADINKSIDILEIETNITQINEQNQTTITQKKIHIKPKNTTVETNKNDDIIRLTINKNKSNILDITKFSKAPLESYRSTYLVKEGDTIGAIARKFNVAQSEILTINPQISKRILKAGKEIFMPVDQEIVDSISNEEYTISHGDTLDKIAKKLKIKTSELKKYNKEAVEKGLTTGKTLVLPLSSNIEKLKSSNNSVNLKKDSIIIESTGKQLRVTASAYTSHVNQTSANPFLAAWGHKLVPGQKTIAVSRDLIEKHGLTNGSKVRIGGLDGEYIVRDKMNKRYKEHIDIYMGLDRNKALRWGRRSATIYW